MPLTARQRQTLLWTAIAVLLVWALIALGPVLTPFAAAAILAYALQPLVEWQVRRRLPRFAAVTITLLLTLLVLVSLILILVPILQRESSQIRTQLPGLVASLTTTLNNGLIPWLRDTLGLSVTLDSAALKTWVAQHLSSSGDDWAALAFNYIKSGSNTIVQFVGLLFLVPVALFYLLLDWPKATATLRGLVPPRWQAVVADWLQEIDTLLGQYVRGQGLVMISLAAYYSICLALAGFELWLPLGVLTGLLIAIPYLGFATGLLFALIAGMLQFGPARGLLSVAIIYGIGQVLEGVGLTPYLVGERIGLHPLAVIFALLAFGFLFGFIGVLLALPMAAVVAIALRRLRRGYVDSDFFARSD